MVEKETGQVVTLASEAPLGKTGGELKPIHYANDLAIASDGTVYFTDSTEIPPAINPAGFYDTMASFLLSAFQVVHNCISCRDSMPISYSNHLLTAYSEWPYKQFY